MNKKGIVLFIVLATIMVVVVLANVIMGIISSQARLTHHQVTRMQAYYAAQAGMNLAMENLRTGTWTTGTYSLCSAGCTVNDPNIPYRVDITISAPDPNTGIRNVSITTTYTYTAPSLPPLPPP